MTCDSDKKDGRAMSTAHYTSASNKFTRGVNAHAWQRYDEDDVLGSILAIFLIVITEKPPHYFHY